jgi:hypothetical protein
VFDQRVDRVHLRERDVCVHGRGGERVHDLSFDRKGDGRRCSGGRDGDVRERGLPAGLT